MLEDKNEQEIIEKINKINSLKKEIKENQTKIFREIRDINDHFESDFPNCSNPCFKGDESYFKVWNKVFECFNSEWTSEEGYKIEEFIDHIDAV